MVRCWDGDGRKRTMVKHTQCSKSILRSMSRQYSSVCIVCVAPKTIKTPRGVNATWIHDCFEPHSLFAGFKIESESL
jgi:hypothetical protein